ncbi:transposase, partial [Streptomyces sp. NPDC048297]|uniref:transposase n=1 Tax=Streptomyces sp. NPDC048297 TaxID=3365531 RepID=UPI00371BC525
MDQENDYRRGRHVVSAMHVHLVFVTKCRRGVFNEEMLTRCEEIMRKVCEDFEAELMEF